MGIVIIIIEQSEGTKFMIMEYSCICLPGDNGIATKNCSSAEPKSDSLSVKPDAERFEPPPSGSTYQAGIDVCESLDLNITDQFIKAKKCINLVSSTDNIKTDIFSSMGTDTELQNYTEEDVVRFETRNQCSYKINGNIFTKPSAINDVQPNLRTKSNEEKIESIRRSQCQLKGELEAAKTRLMIDKSRWSYECKKIIHNEYNITQHYLSEDFYRLHSAIFIVSNIINKSQTKHIFLFRVS